LARTNYSFEKRQRELAKKRKKEEKAAKKAAGGGEDELNPNEAAMALATGGPDGPADGETNDADDGEPAEDSAAPPASTTGG